MDGAEIDKLATIAAAGLQETAACNLLPTVCCLHASCPLRLVSSTGCFVCTFLRAIRVSTVLVVVSARACVCGCACTCVCACLCVCVSATCSRLQACPCARAFFHEYVDWPKAGGTAPPYMCSMWRGSFLAALFRSSGMLFDYVSEDASPGAFSSTGYRLYAGRERRRRLYCRCACACGRAPVPACFLFSSK